MNVILMEPLLISDEYLQELAAPLLSAGHSFTAIPERIPYREQLIEAVREADVLILGNQPLPAAVINDCYRLKMISVAFTGVDHVALDSAEIRKITVCNAAGYATEAVAEHTFGLIFALYRRLSEGDRAVKSRGSSAGLIGRELKGKTLGLVGGGAIACRVAEIVRAFGCRVLVWSRSERPEMKELGAEYAELPQLLQESDIVSLHLPLTAETRGLIGADELSLMKPDAVLINTARGPVADTAALTAALNEGRIAGAALDVFDSEPPLDPDLPLLACPHLVLSPHVGYLTEEAMEQRARIAFDNVYRWLEGKPQNVIC
ncbi:MAG: hydroxyacid dehydrogenase [Firmicutes bacterium]|nr:hydroxyacid dehydrogenase [Bacillota bacterium]